MSNTSSQLDSMIPALDFIHPVFFLMLGIRWNIWSFENTHTHKIKI